MLLIVLRCSAKDGFKVAEKSPLSLSKGAMSHGDAVRVILSGDGRTSPDHFSPAMLKFFRENHEKMDEIFRSGGA